jgi:uncharacterized protein
MSNTVQSDPRWAWLEMGGALATGLIFVAIGKPHLQFIVPVCLLWAGYIGWRASSDRSLLREWGLTTDNLARAMVVPTGVFGISIVAMMVWSLWQWYTLCESHAVSVSVSVSVSAPPSPADCVHRPLWLHWHIVLLLAVYPLWGVVQHLLVQGMLARNAHAILTRDWPLSGDVATVVTTLLSAALFAVVHVMGSRLMVLGTGLLCLWWTPCYLRHRNLLPLGLFHGWIGAFFYFWVLVEDPIAAL